MSRTQMDVRSDVPYSLLRDKDPAAVALHFLRGATTYGDLRRGVGAVVTELQRRGARKGDRAILLGENSEFWIASYLGIMAAGLICVPLPAVSAEDLAYVLEITEATIGFLPGKLAERLTRNLEIVTERDYEALKARPNVDAVVGEPPASGDDLAAIMFTSGSTGKPRGVMVSHANILANTEGIVQSLGLTERDRTMAVLPFHYCFGASLLHTHLSVGGSLVVDNRFMYPEVVLQRMIDTECTGFAGVPSHYQILLRNSSLRRRSFPSLRYVQQAGGCLAPAFIQDLRSALPHTRVFVMYGQTEATARLSCLPPELLDRKLGSIGNGIPGVTLRVLNEQGDEVKPGEIGEIVAAGQNVAKGYWREAEETAAVFRNGMLRTGDLATVDEDGFIYIVDRAKDFLKCAGQRTSCRKLEEQLLGCDELVEVAVVGMPDEVLGEAVKAYVVPRRGDWDGVLDRLRRYCREQMPPQLVPKEVVLVKALPKNSSGKVLKRVLKSPNQSAAAPFL